VPNWDRTTEKQEGLNPTPKLGGFRDGHLPSNPGGKKGAKESISGGNGGKKNPGEGTKARTKRVFPIQRAVRNNRDRGLQKGTNKGQNAAFGGGGERGGGTFCVGRIKKGERKFRNLKRSSEGKEKIGGSPRETRGGEKKGPIRSKHGGAKIDAVMY